MQLLVIGVDGRGLLAYAYHLAVAAVGRKHVQRLVGRLEVLGMVVCGKGHGPGLQSRLGQEIALVYLQSLHKQAEPGFAFLLFGPF